MVLEGGETVHIATVDQRCGRKPLKLHCCRNTDSLSVAFRPEPGVVTREVADGLKAGPDAEGRVFGFGIDRASQLLDLSTLETRELPLHYSSAE